MVALEQRPKITSECIMRLTEAEMRGLSFLMLYGIKAFMTMIDKQYPEGALKPRREGIQTFFETFSREVSPILQRTDDARHAFDGTKQAIAGKP